jgi:hypothetical protein
MPRTSSERSTPPASLPSRTLVWFSCGAASAVAAKYAVGKYPGAEVLYCDTLAYEHPDNRRFLADVSTWIGQPIKILRSERYSDIFDVFGRTGYLVGPKGAKCTQVLKRDVRKDYQRPGDRHIFGFTAEEQERVADFEEANPSLQCDWILADAGITKADCLRQLSQAGITLPAMYLLGYKNNNCIGCVKGGMGYWNKIRRDFPDAFARMAAIERKMNVAICSTKGPNRKRIRVFLDELPPDAGRYESETHIECGPQCEIPK